MRGTMYCHTGRRLGNCLRDDLYKQWKCAEYKAVNYAKLHQVPECLEEVKGGNSEFSLYYKYCVEEVEGEFDNVPVQPTVYDHGFGLRVEFVLFVIFWMGVEV